MANIVFEDVSGTITGIAFESVLTFYGQKPSEGDVVLLSGRLSFREDTPPEIILSSMKKFDKREEKLSKEEDERHSSIKSQGLIVRVSGDDSQIKRKIAILTELYSGETKVIIKDESNEEEIGKIDVSNGIVEAIKKIPLVINVEVL